jgi:poly-gamma-glutamate capsule biosynthesis protein CapA/YwtB (metallophosphatase superfamily)
MKRIATGLLAATVVAAACAVLWAWHARGAREAPAAPLVVTRALPPGKDGTITIVVAGDTMLGGDAQSLLDREGYRFPFAAVAPLTQAADLMIVNLETVVTDRATPIAPRKYAYLRSKPEALEALVWAGVDAVTVANNHALDYGAEGFTNCLQRLEAAGVAYAGGGLNARAARRPLVFHFGSVRIGLLNYMEGYAAYVRQYRFFAERDRPGIARLDERALREDIPVLRKQVDVLLVIVHWGKEFRPVRPAQERLGRLAIDLGADAVLGHHPHSVQDVEVYRGRPILYSLGNFVFNLASRADKDDGMLARLTIRGQRLAQVELIPLVTRTRLVQFQPRPATPDETRAFLDKLLPPSAARGAAIRRDVDRGWLDLADAGGATNSLR